ncbi:unnamed protein product [Gongylonema pulchrum]|uniref:Uncharacterized protein n=1 Tax=Gongylonema pulchrum TaxID=637853 RepID=A0A183E7M0_9BILA|nr:unnamed protein product [Gongylonema pulchrum]
MRALRRLFSCTTPSRPHKASSPRRTRSWSPQYDGRENFLSKEEKQLRWAFRKNQPLDFGRKTNEAEISQPAGTTEAAVVPSEAAAVVPSEAAVVSSSQPSSPASSRLAPSPEVSPKSDSDRSALFTTAPESSMKNERHETSNDSFFDALSREAASLKIDDTSSWIKAWMTEESSSRKSRGEYTGPLIDSTRPAYQLKLARFLANMTSSTPKLKYSWALESWMAGKSFPEGEKLDRLLVKSFERFPSEDWREGSRPTSFCYVLIGKLKSFGTEPIFFVRKKTGYAWSA